MRPAQLRRGEPLLALLAVLGGWCTARLLLWGPPFALAGFSEPPPADVVTTIPADPAAAVPAPKRYRLPRWSHVAGRGRDGAISDGAQGWAQFGSMSAVLAGPSPVGINAPQRQRIPAQTGELQVQEARQTRSDNPAPAGVGAPAATAVGAERRWRIDGWLLARAGPKSIGLAPGTRPAAYGASQIGAVLRYRLGPAEGTAPFLFARASQALADNGETDVAAGVGWRPLASLPLAAHGELRLTDTGEQRLIRPAAYVVTELPPWQPGEATAAEAYVQAGYVGGDFATLFVDGQARIERRLARPAGAELRLGAGAWGGAQKGAARLDVGPTASLRFDLGDVPLRLAVDYRLRLAGDAEPGSGVAVTIVSGF